MIKTLNLLWFLTLKNKHQINDTSKETEG